MLPEGSETQAPGELAQLGEDAAVVMVVWQSRQRLGLTCFRAGCRGAGWRRHSPDHSKDMGQGPDLSVPHKRQCHTNGSVTQTSRPGLGTQAGHAVEPPRQEAW